MSKTNSTEAIQLDAMDMQIVEILRGGYENHSSIAKTLGVSEGTIRNRVQRLRESGVLVVRGQIDPEILSAHQLAIIGVNVAEAKLLDAKAKEIAKLDHVLSVSIVSGRYDLMVELLVESNQGLVRFLTETLSRVKGIAKTESFLLLKSYQKYV